MINDLDKTLEELLKRELAPELVSQVTISFATPDDQFPPTSVTLPAIDIFLYDVRENLDLRSNEWMVKRHSDGTATRKRPAVRVECSYLITAWPSESAPNPAQDEHHLLGEAMKALLRHPTIPAGMLQGSLKGQEPPLPVMSLQSGRLQSLGEFWQALGGKPKATLNYSVTIAIEPFEAIEERVVMEKIIAIKPDIKR
ncbi:MAG: DUF4255 domain-containing protein [Deltaproteobacteria bacterium]|nr:DUF4255 domain-containing protein [Deltaproteobacteria bacterium]